MLFYLIDEHLEKRRKLFWEFTKYIDGEPLAFDGKYKATCKIDCQLIGLVFDLKNTLLFSNCFL
jgi:hypothetical protein